jgi:hypothetical protein
MWQENSTSYGQQYNTPFYDQQHSGVGAQSNPLQFYNATHDQSGFYSGARPSLEGSMDGSNSGFGGNMQPTGGWWVAFGTGGFEGESPLLEGNGDLAAVNVLRVDRTRHQLFTHQIQIDDRLEPATQSRRTHHG